MELVREIQYLFEELKVFHRNLNKDNNTRRKDIRIINCKLKKLDKFKDIYANLKNSLNKLVLDSELRDQVRGYANAIDKQLGAIQTVLKERSQELATELPSVSSVRPTRLSESSISSISEDECTEIMAEKFDLRTAASLLPVMDNTENGTKQLIDAIELYDALLDAASQKLLTNYILKKCLSQSAKIRLNSAYTSNDELVADLKKHFFSKKSLSALTVQLNNAKQGSKTIDQFGKSVEELLVDLTITQSNGNQDAIKILRPINEKIAINTFANGLRNSDLKTIVKARDYAILGDAIQGAKDEEISFRNSGDQVLHMRGNNYSRRGSSYARKSNSNYRGNQWSRGNNNNNSRGYNNFRGSDRSRGNNYFKNFNTRGQHSRGGPTYTGTASTYNSNQGGTNFKYNARASYCMADVNNPTDNACYESRSGTRKDQFFRVQNAE